MNLKTTVHSSNHGIELYIFVMQSMMFRMLDVM
jgi:hypothetical protein